MSLLYIPHGPVPQVKSIGNATLAWKSWPLKNEALFTSSDFIAGPPEHLQVGHTALFWHERGPEVGTRNGRVE